MTTENVMTELARINYQHYDTLTRETIAWMDRHLTLIDAGYIAYALTVTYLPNMKSAKGHTTSAIQTRFKKLYFHNFIRHYIFDGCSKWAKHFNAYQPYIDIFEEAHEHGAIHRPHLDEQVWKEYQFSNRLHHHAIMYVHPMHVEKMDKLIGENTLKQFNEDAVMTSCIKRVRDIGWTGYSLKCQHRYTASSMHFGPQGLDFPACRISTEPHIQ